jgi:hypothetical protein
MYNLIIAAGNQVKLSGFPQAKADSGAMTHIFTIVLMTLAGIAVLFVILGGVRYILSQGDPQATSKAKNTVLTAIIGLVIVIVAQAVVSLVVSKL